MANESRSGNSGARGGGVAGGGGGDRKARKESPKYVAKKAARERIAEQRAAQARRQRNQRVLAAVGAVVVVIAVVVLVAVFATGGGSKKGVQAKPVVPASDAITTAISTVPDSVFAAVPITLPAAPPRQITGDLLTKDGKPEVFYMGAEYCPFCASERWPLTIALERFGNFSGLKSTYSSPTDAYPNTPTLSYLGSTYTSDYVTFTSVETLSNDPTPTPLQTPTADQEALVSKYLGPNAGIPVIDFGNRLLQSGASYNPQLLAGKTPEEVAKAAVDPSTDIGKSVLVTANTFTAQICKLTGDQPSSVCDTPTITKMKGQLDALPAPSAAPSS